MLNVLGVVFTSKNKNIKSIAFILGFCSSSKGVSSLNFSLLHFPTLPLRPAHCLIVFPFPEVVSFSALLLPDIPSSVSSWLSPFPFCAKSDRFLCKWQQGQHTDEAVRSTLLESESCLLLSLFTLFIQKLFLQSFSLPASSASLYTFASPKALYFFFHVFISCF